MLGKAFSGVLCAVLLAVVSFAYFSVQPVQPPILQTAAVCGSGQSSTGDAADKMCPQPDGVSTYYDINRSCGAVYDAAKCSGTINALASPSNASELAAGVAATVLSACAKNKANCACGEVDSGVATQGTCAAPSKCQAYESVSSDGQMCTYSKTCTTHCDAASAEGKKEYQQLSQEYAGSANPIKQTSYTTSSNNSPPPTPSSLQDTKGGGTTAVQGAGSAGTGGSSDSGNTIDLSADGNKSAVQPSSNPPQQAPQAGGSTPIETQPLPTAQPSQPTTQPSSAPPPASIVTPSVPSTQGGAAVSSANPIFAGSGVQSSLAPPPQTPSTVALAAPQGKTFLPTKTTFTPTVSYSAPQQTSVPVSRTPTSISSIGNAVGLDAFASFVGGLFSSLLSPAPAAPTYVSGPAPASVSPVSNTGSSASVPQVVFVENLAPALSYDQSAPSSLSTDLSPATVAGLTSPGIPQSAAQESADVSNDLLQLKSGPELADSLSTILAPETSMPNVQTLASSSEASLVQATRSGTLALNALLNPETVPDQTPLALEVISRLQGQWTYSPEHLSDESALAQAESDFAWIEAQIEAMKAAQQAGACDQTCLEALEMLQSNVPGAEDRIEELQKVVDAAPPESYLLGESGQTPDGIFAEVTGFDQLSTQGAGSTPQTLSTIPTLAELAAQNSAPATVQIPEALPDSPPVAVGANGQLYVPPEALVSAPEAPTAPESPLLKFLSNLVQKVAQWFEPTSTSTVARSHSCSLLSSLFGGCKGW